MRLRQPFIAILCSLAIAFATPRTAAADWDSAGRLPGLISGGQLIRDVLVMVGVAALGGYVGYKLLGKNRPDGVRALHDRVTFEGGTAFGEITFVNASKTPVRVLNIALRQGTEFRLDSEHGVSLPLDLAPQEPLRVKVLFTAATAGRVRRRGSGLHEGVDRREGAGRQGARARRFERTVRCDGSRGSDQVIAALMLAATLVGNLSQESAVPAAWTVSGPADPVVLDVADAKARRVSLRVLTDKGQPVVGVTVTLTAPGTGPRASLEKGLSELTRVSDKQGRVSFRLTPNQEAGRWPLRVRATRGHETTVTEVSIANGLPDRNEKRAFGMGVFVLLVGAISLLGTLAQL